MTESLTQIPDGAQTRIYTWNEDEDPYALLVQHLPPGTLGIDERVQFVFANRIQLADPARKLVSAIPVISGCRQIKSPAELALMQLANNITLAVYKAAYESAGPGITNEDFSNLCTLGYKQSGVQGEASCQVGEWSALPHGSPRPQTIREGQVVLIDDGCFVHGYQSDMSRSFVYGKPSDKQLKVFEIVHRAQAAALAAARPGVPCHRPSTTPPARSSPPPASAPTTKPSRTGSATASAWTCTSGPTSSAATRPRSPPACASPTNPASTSPASSASASKTTGTSPNPAASCSPPNPPRSNTPSADAPLQPYHNKLTTPPHSGRHAVASSRSLDERAHRATLKADDQPVSRLSWYGGRARLQPCHNKPPTPPHPERGSAASKRGHDEEPHPASPKADEN